MLSYFKVVKWCRETLSFTFLCVSIIEHFFYYYFHFHEHKLTTVRFQLVQVKNKKQNTKLQSKTEKILIL